MLSSASLMSLLKNEYDTMMVRARETVARDPSQQSHLDKASTVEGFVAFCERFLARNRVVSTYFPGSGIGLQFQDGKRLPLARQLDSPTEPPQQPAERLVIKTGRAVAKSTTLAAARRPKTELQRRTEEELVAKHGGQTAVGAGGKKLWRPAGGAVSVTGSTQPSKVPDSSIGITTGEGIGTGLPTSSGAPSAANMSSMPGI